jgi:hypothetical protein
LKNTAQQSVHWTLGILPPSQAVFYALAFFQSDGFAPSAPAPVPITAVVKDPKINDFYVCQVELIRAVKEKNSHGSFLGTIYS